MKELTRQFALFKQTISSDTRNISLQLIRLSFACVLGYFIYATQEQANQWRKVDGLYLFYILTNINLIFILFSSMFLFMTLIKEEKEENTLDLILMTGISPFAFLIGKMGSRIVYLFIMLLVQVPFTYLCVTLGGLSVTSILQVYLILFFLACFLAPLSTLVSMFCTSFISGAFILTGLFVLLSGVVMSIEKSFFYSSNFPPFGAIESILLRAGNNSSAQVFTVCSIYLVLGLSILTLASLIFQNLIKPQKEISIPGKDSANGSKKAFSMLFGIFGMRRIKKWAVFYKGYKYNLNGTWMWLFQLVWISLLVWYNIDELYARSWRWNYYDSSTSNLYRFSQACLPGTGILLLVMTVGVGSRIFSFEIKNRTLGTLLMLPQKSVKLYWQNIFSSVRCILPSIITFITLFVIIADEHGGDSTAEFLSVMIVLLTCFFISTAASMAAGKFTFFIAAGSAAAYFFAFLMWCRLMLRNEQEVLISAIISGGILTLFCISYGIKKMESHC